MTPEQFERQQFAKDAKKQTEEHSVLGFVLDMLNKPIVFLGWLILAVLDN